MAELLKKSVLNLFPSQLFRGTISDLSLCKDIADKLIKLKESGNGIFEHDCFMTTDMLQEDPNFFNLAELILKESAYILDYQGVVRDSHYITSMWGNVNPSNHMHMMHIHPNSLLSGVIYISVPDKCSPTVFGDPRPGANVFEPNYSKMPNTGVFKVPPETGTMLLWNSWLPHGVDKGHNVDGLRIVVAFNIMIKGKISTKTAPLVL
jgi:uncharacterized protein (TIGR02466 family)